MRGANALANSPLMGRLLQDMYEVFDKEVLPLLGSTTCALFGRVSQACRDAVGNALLQQSSGGELTCAGRSPGVKFILEHFVSTFALLSWAKDNGCPWDDRTCEAAFAGGQADVLAWALEQGCPWDSGVLREWRRQCPKLQELWDEEEQVTVWQGVTYHGADKGRVVVMVSLHDQGLTGDVHAALGELTALISLNLGNNRLTSVPATLGELSALRVLSLNNNLLTSVPAELGGLTELRVLDLSDNQLTSVPATLGGLTLLMRLFLNNNQLTSVPAALGGLTALTGLFLQKNKLTSLPAALGGLSALRGLFISNNQLMSVPASFGGLTALSHLTLFNNHLTRTSVPVEWEEIFPVVWEEIDV
jgi:hypothetical protein